MNLLLSILHLVYFFLEVYLYFIIFVLILGFIPEVQNQRWYQSCEKIADFYIGRFKGLLVLGHIDFTPVLGIIIYDFALQVIDRLIHLI